MTTSDVSSECQNDLFDCSLDPQVVDHAYSSTSLLQWILWFVILTKSGLFFNMCVRARTYWRGGLRKYISPHELHDKKRQNGKRRNPKNCYALESLREQRYKNDLTSTTFVTHIPFERGIEEHGATLSYQLWVTEATLTWFIYLLSCGIELGSSLTVRALAAIMHTWKKKVWFLRSSKWAVLTPVVVSTILFVGRLIEDLRAHAK